MTTGVGICMGSVTSVTASVTAGQPRPSVRVRPTTLAFDDHGTAGIGAPGVARVGAAAEISGSAANFADLTAETEPIVVAGRLWTPAALVAAVVRDLLRAEPPRAGVVLAHPAVYGADDVARLAQALDLAGAGHVLPVPEPVAAAEWLDAETGPLATGFVLVYDLGATSLDLGVVRVGPDWPDHPLVGTPVRSREFGGEPLGARIAEQAYRRPGATGTRGLDTEGLRAEHIRATFPLVLDCLAGCDLGPAELTGILLVGGAARPPEVARTLGELGVPVLRGADPGHTIALGAAAFAARTMAPPVRRAEPVAHIGVFSSAALVSALAMSAATVFGGPAPQFAPGLERFPRMEGALGVGQGIARVPVAGAVVGGAVPSAGGRVPAARGGPVGSAAAPVRVYGPLLAPVARGGTGGDRAPRVVPWSGTYRNPARFTNPLPFLEHYGLGFDERAGIGPGLLGASPIGSGAVAGETGAGQVPGGTSAGAAGTSGASPAGGPVDPATGDGAAGGGAPGGGAGSGAPGGGAGYDGSGGGGGSGGSGSPGGDGSGGPNGGSGPNGGGPNGGGPNSGGGGGGDGSGGPNGGGGGPIGAGGGNSGDGGGGNGGGGNTGGGNGGGSNGNGGGAGSDGAGGSGAGGGRSGHGGAGGTSSGDGGSGASGSRSDNGGAGGSGKGGSGDGGSGKGSNGSGGKGGNGGSGGKGGGSGGGGGGGSDR